MKTTQLKIDIIADVVCPWCIIGYKRLEKALDTIHITADIKWHPFELNPNISQDGENLRTHLAAKYGTTLKESIQARAKITQLGTEVGFKFDYFDEMKMFNTFSAHQLLYYAEIKHKATELRLRLFSAFFGEHKAINQLKILVDEAVNVGLDRAETYAVLKEQRYANLVRAEEHKWTKYGINSVPTFILNNTYIITGAQSTEYFIEAISKLMGCLNK